MVVTLQELPTELLYHTLQYLPISDLLSYARTSKTNYGLSVQALTSLDLAVFPRKIHSLLAFFDVSSDDEDEDGEEDPPISRYWDSTSSGDKSLYQIGLTTTIPSRPSLSRSNTPPFLPKSTGKERKQTPSPPPTALSLRTAEITSQNNLAANVLSTSSLRNLRNLSLRLYDLTSPALATVIATSFPALNNLSLEFSHPYIHDTILPARFWKQTVPTGSPIWNILSGLGDVNNTTLRLRSLRSLKLTRSGITSSQLRQWIESNPQLKELRLSLCRGVDAEFVEWLGTYMASGCGKLEIIRLTDCGLLELKTEKDFAFVNQLARAGVQELSLRGSKGANEDTFSRLTASMSDSDNGNPWSLISKLVSPNGVIRRRKPTQKSAIPDQTSWFDESDDDTPFVTTRGRLGSVSPALTVSDGMIGAERSGYFSIGKIELDPTLVL